ncbi:MAG TPA: universal stress protein [Jatrophihabitans sp.]|nr:universal stress protein [Jatrophihabitans sp.]
MTVAVADVARDRPALCWAAAEAAGRGLPLWVVHAYEWQPGPVWTGRLRSVPDSLLAEEKAAAERVLADAIAECRSFGAGIEIAGGCAEGSATDVLAEASREAELLVLGAAAERGRRFGSTGQAVAERSASPVVIVRAGPLPDRTARVVIGLDLQCDSHASLTFALDAAHRRQATLEAVTCWQPTLMDSESMLEPVLAAEQAEIEQRLCEELLPWRQKYPDVEVLASVLERHPVDGLVERADGCGLLVLGRPGSHPVRATLGSVHLAAARRVSCPVALVPAAQAG